MRFQSNQQRFGRATSSATNAGVVAALAILLVGAAGSASAQSPSPSQPTFELEQLELNPSGLGPLFLGTAELLPAGTFRSAMLAHYEHEPLYYRSGGALLGRAVRERLTLHLMRQYSLAGRVELALQLPIIVYQGGDDLTGAGLMRLPNGGLGTPALSARVAVLRSLDGAPLDLSVQATALLPFGNDAGFANNSGLALAPRLLASKRVLGRFLLTGEAGGLLRPPVVFGDDRIHHSLLGGLGVSTFGRDLNGELGLRASYGFGRQPVAVEVLGGVRYRVNEVIELNALASIAPARAAGTPMFRILFGASYLEGARLEDLDGPELTSEPPFKPEPAPEPIEAPEPEPTPVEKPTCVPGEPYELTECPALDLDEDGVPNAQDRCPTEPEDTDGFEDADGCPDPDNDGDGLLDTADKCPVEAGTVERDGCPIPDEDADGVPDADDACPAEPGPPAMKGCPLKDADGDGILDDADACPREPGPLEARGCPVQDTDKDGVPDHKDNCRTEKGTAKNQGCPAQKQQRVIITERSLVILDKVFFRSGRAQVLQRSHAVLDNVADVLKEHPEIKKVVVEGHTDDRGAASYNLRLSQQRAEAVRDYLIDRGVPAERLDAKGFGEERPAFPNLLASGRRNNRRVEFTIPEPDTETRTESDAEGEK